MQEQSSLAGALRFMQEDFSEHKERLEQLANSQNPHTLFIGCCDSRVVPNVLLNAAIGELFVVRNIANIIPPYRANQAAETVQKPVQNACETPTPETAAATAGENPLFLQKPAQNACKIPTPSENPLFLQKPVQSPEPQQFFASSAAIEYALEALKVRDIIICGHSNCGGCKDLSPAAAARMPHVAGWLRQLAPIKEQVDRALELSHLEGDAALRAWMIERANVVASYENLLSYPSVAARLAEGSLRVRAWYFVVASAVFMQYDPASGHFKTLKEIEID